MTDSSPAARAAHYRRLAMQTYDLADHAEDPEVIGAFLVIAAKWLSLADHVEQSAPTRLAA